MNSAYSYGSAEEGEGRFDGSIDGFKYGRYSHPNLAMLQERLVALEEGAEACVVTASGMAAMFAAIMCHVKTGDHVVASRVLFSSCHYVLTQVLPRFGIRCTLVDGTEPASWKRAITPDTTLVFIETPANPTLALVDIAMVAALCRKVGALFVVDNVFATPLLQQPLALGADVVMYSTTKHMDGQGRTLGGALLGSKKWVEGTLMPFVRHTGPHMSPFNAWVLTKALETLPLRVARHCDNAQAIAQALEGHAKLVALHYPGLPSHPHYAIAQKQMRHGGPILALDIKGGKKAAFRFLNALRIFDISNNLGNTKSLATHPASTTHASLGAAERKKLGIGDGLVRLSIGIEDAGDLLADLQHALGEV